MITLMNKSFTYHHNHANVDVNINCLQDLREFAQHHDLNFYSICADIILHDYSILGRHIGYIAVN